MCKQLQTHMLSINAHSNTRIYIQYYIIAIFQGFNWRLLSQWGRWMVVQLVPPASMITLKSNPADSWYNDKEYLANFSTLPFAVVRIVHLRSLLLYVPSRLEHFWSRHRQNLKIKKQYCISIRWHLDYLWCCSSKLSTQLSLFPVTILVPNNSCALQPSFLAKWFGQLGSIRYCYDLIRISAAYIAYGGLERKHQNFGLDQVPPSLSRSQTE